MPDKSTIQRLAFIKYLHGLAVEQSKAAEPMNAVSLLTMHDPVELFLVLAAKAHNLSTKDRTFMDYWDLLILKGKISNVFPRPKFLSPFLPLLKQKYSFHIKKRNS